MTGTAFWLSLTQWPSTGLLETKYQKGARHAKHFIAEDQLVPIKMYCLTANSCKLLPTVIWKTCQILQVLLLPKSSLSLDKHRIHLQIQIQLFPPQPVQRAYQKEKWAPKLMLLQGKCPFKVHEMHKDVSNFTSKTFSKEWRTVT